MKKTKYCGTVAAEGVYTELFAFPARKLRVFKRLRKNGSKNVAM